MAAALKALFDKRKMALARARLRAWWDGHVFDPEAALAAIEATANDTGDVESELFDAPPYEPPPRLAALTVMWGDGRIRPGDAADEATAPQRLALAPDGVLALLGPGGAAPVFAAAEAHPGRVEVFEWRDEAIAALHAGLAKAQLQGRVSIAKIDIEAYVFTPASFDALVSIDDFAYSGYAPHLAQQMYKALKPSAQAMIDIYVGFKSPELSTAFASSFAEPQIRPHGDILQVLQETGLTIVSDDDLTDTFLRLAREGYQRLSDSMDSIAKLDVLGAQELAWEVEAWRMRMRLLAQRRLERRRIIVQRPAAEA